MPKYAKDEDYRRWPIAKVRIRQLIEEMDKEQITRRPAVIELAQALGVRLDQFQWHWVERGDVPADWEARLLAAVCKIREQILCDFNREYVRSIEIERWLINDPAPPAPPAPEMPKPMLSPKRAAVAV
jgi:hypothetical protein